MQVSTYILKTLYMAFDRLSNRSDEFCMNLSLKSRDLEKQFNGYYDD